MEEINLKIRTKFILEANDVSVRIVRKNISYMGVLRGGFVFSNCPALYGSWRHLLTDVTEYDDAWRLTNNILWVSDTTFMPKDSPNTYITPIMDAIDLFNMSIQL